MRTRDVLEVLLPQVDEGCVHLVAHLPIRVFRQANPARLANAFEPRGDVDSVAHQIAVGLLHDIAEVNADAIFDALLVRRVGVALDHAALHFHGAAHGLNHAAKLDNRPVAGPLDHPPVVNCDRRAEKVGAQRPESGERALLVDSHQPAVAYEVSDQNRCKFPDLAHLVIL